MVGAFMVVGALAEATAWTLVVARRGTVWTIVTPVLAGLGVVTLLVEVPPGATRVELASASVVGLAAGAALYVATLLFAFVVRGWRRFGDQSREIYARRTPLTVNQALVVATVVAAPAEELFWRGLFQTGMTDALDGRAGIAALVTVVAFVLSNVPSRNLAIVLGAAVGGAVWSVLAWWSGGVVAPIVCHAVWTGLMLAFPVVTEPAEVAI
jgi:membrane protease YdiL (CAAX protease family)